VSPAALAQLAGSTGRVGAWAAARALGTVLGRNGFGWRGRRPRGRASLCSLTRAGLREAGLLAGSWLSVELGLCWGSPAAGALGGGCPVALGPQEGVEDAKGAKASCKCRAELCWKGQEIARARSVQTSVGFPAPPSRCRAGLRGAVCLAPCSGSAWPWHFTGLWPASLMGSPCCPQHWTLLSVSLFNCLLSTACSVGLALAIALTVHSRGMHLLMGCNSSVLPADARAAIATNDCPFNTTRIYVSLQGHRTPPLPPALPLFVSAFSLLSCSLFSPPSLCPYSSHAPSCSLSFSLPPLLFPRCLSSLPAQPHAGGLGVVGHAF